MAAHACGGGGDVVGGPERVDDAIEDFRDRILRFVPREGAQVPGGHTRSLAVLLEESRLELHAIDEEGLPDAGPDGIDPVVGIPRVDEGVGGQVNVPLFLRPIAPEGVARRVEPNAHRHDRAGGIEVEPRGSVAGGAGVEARVVPGVENVWSRVQRSVHPGVCGRVPPSVRGGRVVSTPRRSEEEGKSGENPENVFHFRSDVALPHGQVAGGPINGRDPRGDVRVRVIRIWAFAFVLSSSLASAQAEDPPLEPAANYDANLDEAARLTFQRAREAFDAGRYEDALARFQQAYELSPRPTLLYNIAATLDRLRRDEETVVALRAYLDAVPAAPDRTEVEARIGVLEASLAQRREREEAAAAAAAAAAAERDARANPPPPPSERESHGLHPAIAIAVGGAALVAGGLIVWSGLDANSQNDDYIAYSQSEGATFEEAKARYDDTVSAERRTNALIGVAAGLGATAAVLLIFTDFGGSSDEDTLSFTGGFTQSSAMVGARGSF